MADQIQEKNPGVGGQLSAMEVQTYIEDISYPASKEKLIAKAEGKSAPREILDILYRLPEGSEYGNWAELLEELENLIWMNLSDDENV